MSCFSVGFTPDSAALFCTITSTTDNRISVFETDSGKLIAALVDKDHLKAANKTTCVAMGAVVVKKKSTVYVAAGLASGVVTLWNVVLGTSKSFEGGHSGKVTAIAIHDSFVYSCAEDKSICRWKIDGTLVHKWTDESVCTCVAVAPNGEFLVTGSAGLVCWDISSYSKLHSFVGGHVSSITNINFSSDSKYIFSNDSDRFISVWSLDSAKALQVLPLDTAPTSTSCNGSVLCVVSADSAQVYSLEPSKKKPFKSNLKCSVTISGTSKIISSLITEYSVIFASGTSAGSFFDRVDFTTQDKFEIVSRTIVDGIENKKTAKKAATLSVVASNSAPITMPLITVPAVSAPVEEEGPSGKRAKKSKKNVPSEPSLEEKLQAAVSADHSAVQETKSSILLKSLPSQPQADSILSVLVQALATNDNNLLEYCLSTNNLSMIQQTVERLPESSVLPFLTKVVDKFQTTPARALSLVGWIKEILTRHTTVLLRTPTLAKSLTNLYSTIENRVGIFRKLTKLSGRLDLLLSQLENNGNEGAAAVSISKAIIYDENGDAKLLGKRNVESVEMEEDSNEVDSDDMESD